MRTLQIVLVVGSLLALGFVLQPAAEAATSMHAAVPGARPAYRGTPSHSYGSYGHGSGHYGHGSSYYGHGSGYYGHGYSHYGHGYYGYGYSYPYYRGYYGWGLGFGWGGWGYPYSYYGYGYPYYGYGYGYPYSAATYYGYGEVRTEVKPKSAQVFVDGGYVGVVDSFDGWWQRLNVERGDHRLVFRAPGFAPYVIDLRILPGTEYNVKYQMQPGEDRIAEQDMRPKNDDRGGYVPRNRSDDRYRDRDPYSDRDEGEDRGSDRDREYDPQRPSERYHLEGNMPAQEDRSGKREMTLQVQPSDATIYIDGTYYGTSDGGNAQVMLTDGPHKIEVVRPGYETFEKNIQVGENFTSSMTIMLQKK
ncbi:MAG TPA: PEGA domain-containing protein [Acidobacteriota bacterium]|nr:PEGA domain-containing protein [Acidobacteriota bacterium]